MQGTTPSPARSLTQHARHITTNCVASSSRARIAPLPQKSVLEISGPDAPKFLKGLTCKDVDAIGGGYSGFINASGRVLHTTFIFPLKPTSISKPTYPTYLITHESPSTHPTPLETFLPPFKLRSKVKIKDVSSQWAAWASWGEDVRHSGAVDNSGQLPARVWKLGSGGAAESQWSWDEGIRNLDLPEGEVGCWDLRAGYENGIGRQMLIPIGQEASLSKTHTIASTVDYNLHRMVQGIPEGPQEIIPSSALPLESCMDVHGGVDFRKGCYLGQELTVRTYHTGATRKRLLPIRLIPLDPVSQVRPLTSFLPNPADPYAPLEYDEFTNPVTEEITRSEITYYPGRESVSQKPKSAGKILSLLPSNVGMVGIGLVRTEMASKTWWSPVLSPDSPELRGGGSVGEWWNGVDARLGVKVGDVEFGVWVGEGEGYAAARRELGRVERDRAAAKLKVGSEDV